MRSVPSAERLLRLLLLLTATAARAGEAAPPEPRPPDTLDAAALDRLVDPASRDDTLASLVEAADVHALPVLRALLEGTLYRGPAAVLVDRKGTLQDALTGAPVPVDRDELEPVTINNRFRKTLDRAVAALSLLLGSASDSLAAAQVLQAEPGLRGALLGPEGPRARDGPEVQEALRATAAMLALASPEPTQRLAAK